jgi:hypothetical protein
MAQGVKNYYLDSKKRVKFEMNLTLRVCGGGCGPGFNSVQV